MNKPETASAVASLVTEGSTVKLTIRTTGFLGSPDKGGFHAITFENLHGCLEAEIDGKKIPDYRRLTLTFRGDKRMQQCEMLMRVILQSLSELPKCLKE